MNFFYSCLCHFCKATSEDIKHCASCKIVGYCSKEHQKRDWRSHKELCNVISRTNFPCLSDIISSHKDLISYKTKVSLAWSTSLRRLLKPFESQMWMFLRTCNVCYSQINLLFCKNCMNVSYCSESHQQQDEQNHAQFCNKLKLCMLIDCYLFKNTIEDTDIKEIQNIVETYPTNLTEFLKLILYTFDSLYINEQIKFILQAEKFNHIATILYVLEKLSVVNKRQLVSDSLVIHIIGAGSSELLLDWPLIFMLLSQWMFNVDKITIILLGPELSVEQTVMYSATLRLNNKTVAVVLKGYNGYYHELLHQVPKPDVIAAFNSGLHEFEGSANDTWKDSLKSMMSFSNVPLLLTAYTEDEIVNDVKRFQSMKDVVIIMKPHKNPFSSIRPLRDWCSIQSPVYYINNFISVLQKKGSPQDNL